MIIAIKSIQVMEGFKRLTIPTTSYDKDHLLRHWIHSHLSFLSLTDSHHDDHRIRCHQPLHPPHEIYWHPHNDSKDKSLYSRVSEYQQMHHPDPHDSWIKKAFFKQSRTRPYGIWRMTSDPICHQTNLKLIRRQLRWLRERESISESWLHMRKVILLEIYRSDHHDGIQSLLLNFDAISW